MTERGDILRRIGSRICDARKSRGLTQQELSERSGITREKISAYEHGQYDIKVISLVRIAEALGIEAKELI